MDYAPGIFGKRSQICRRVVRSHSRMAKGIGDAEMDHALNCGQPASSLEIHSRSNRCFDAD
jgi:hypothetical protein